jgi:D-glycero-D-manno-heptose 1,7-bisphosphate phosphatase
MKRFIFLDRDGTVCVEKEYLDDYKKMEFLPDVDKAIKIFKENGYCVVIVTNQSGVARGKFSLEEAERQKKYFLEYFLKKGIVIDGYYYCPHHVDGIIKEFSIDCDCRKPKRGMIDKAIEGIEVNMAKSYVVGDKLIDIELARNIGLIPVLVRTGYGREEEKKLIDKKNILVFENLYKFALFVKEVK